MNVAEDYKFKFLKIQKGTFTSLFCKNTASNLTIVNETAAGPERVVYLKLGILKR